MKNKLIIASLLLSSFAYAQNNDRSYPIMLNKVDTLNKKVNLAGMYLEQSANYQEKSFNVGLLGAVFSPMIAYIGIRNNNKDIVNISYAIGVTCAFTSIHFKFKSIESLRQASKHLPYQNYIPLK
jgi:hypothetical protein